MSATGGGPASGAGQQPSEEELRAAYEAEIKKVRIEHVLLEQVVTLVNLGMRRTGIAPGTESERDPGQVRLAIEAVRGLLPLVEQAAPAQAGPIRDALSQMQLAYVRIGGQPSSDREPQAEGAASAGAGAFQGSRPGADPDPGTGQGTGRGGAADEPPAPKPGDPGPAQRSGRLWIPGQ
jgi:hypothetical protein